MRSISSVIILSLLASGEPASLSGQTLFPWFDLKVDTGAVSVNAFGTGRVQGGARDTRENESVNANGSAGLALQMSALTVAGFVNVVSSIDTVMGDFGPALLTPAAGGGLRAGVMELRFHDLLRRNYGVRAYGSVSSAVWADTLRQDTAYSVSIVGAGITVFRQWQALDTIGRRDSIPKQVWEVDRVAFALEGGVAWRRISGDIAAQSEFRRHLLGTEARSFLGLEGGMTITINKFAATIQIYRMWSLRGATLGGLTGTQMSTGLTLEGTLFSFRSKLQ